MFVNILQFTVCFPDMFSPMSFITTPIKNENMEAQCCPRWFRKKWSSRGRSSFFWSQGTFFPLKCTNTPLDPCVASRWRREHRGKMAQLGEKGKRTEARLGRVCGGRKWCGGEISWIGRNLNDHITDFSDSWARYLGKLLALVSSFVK